MENPELKNEHQRMIKRGKKKNYNKFEKFPQKIRQEPHYIYTVCRVRNKNLKMVCCFL